MNIRLERVLWHNELKGHLNKNAVQTYTITNYRVLLNESAILLRDIDDIVIMDRRRVPVQGHTGDSTSIGVYNSSFQFGNINSTIKTIGDICFISARRSCITFPQVLDPHRVVRLANAARKRSLSVEKLATHKFSIRSQRKKESIIRSSNSFFCLRCSSTNPSGSRYCNKCGYRISMGDSDKSIISTPAVASLAKSIDNMNLGVKFLNYESLSTGLKIQYPSNWVIVNSELKGHFTVAFKSQPQSICDYAQIVAIDVRNLPLHLSLRQYIDVNVIDLRKKYANFRLIESAPTTLATNPAHRLVYSEGGQKLMHNVTIKNNTVYQIVFSTRSEVYHNYLPIVQKMINSFGITK